MIRNILYKGTQTLSWKFIAAGGGIIALFTSGVYRKLLSDASLHPDEVPGMILSVIIQVLYIVWAYKMIRRTAILNSDTLYLKTFFSDYSIDLKKITGLNLVKTEANTQHDIDSYYAVSYEITVNNAVFPLKIKEDEQFETLMMEHTGLCWEKRFIEPIPTSEFRMIPVLLDDMVEKLRQYKLRKSI